MVKQVKMANMLEMNKIYLKRNNTLFNREHQTVILKDYLLH